MEHVSGLVAADGTKSFDWLADRLQKQIRWYEAAAFRSRIAYLSLRLLTLCAAAAITIISITSCAPPGWQPTWLPGILSALIALFEGVQGLFHWRDQWLSYRATAEGLKREQSLYLAQASPYDSKTSPDVAQVSPSVGKTSLDALALLAVRAEQLMTSENASWRQLHDRADEYPAAPHDRAGASGGGRGPTTG